MFTSSRIALSFSQVSESNKDLFVYLCVYTCIFLYVGRPIYGAIEVLHNAFFCKCDTHPPTRTANNVGLYTFITLICTDAYTPHTVFYIEPVRRPQADNFQPGLATLLLAGPTGRQLFV